MIHTLLANSPDKLFQALNTYLVQQTKAEQFSGSVLVAHANTIILNQGYGYANIEHHIANTPDTKFRIASITKPFTALAIMQLHERGLLSIHDKLSNYIPDFPGGNDITIAHLLSHQSGIFNIKDLPHLNILKNSPIASLEEYIGLFKYKPSVFKPGTKQEYSNSNYITLAYIIEKVSGKTYENYLYDAVFKPLGMENTGLDKTSLVLPLRAYGYIKKENTLQKAEHLDMSWALSSGGLYSTTYDLYLWDRALYTDTLLSKEGITALFTPYGTMHHDPTVGYGYGWEISAVHGKRFVRHPGRMYGVATEIYRFLDDNTVIIILSNLENAPVEQIAHQLARIVFS